MVSENSIESNNYVKRNVKLLSASNMDDHIQKAYNCGFLLEAFSILNSIIELYLKCIYTIEYGKNHLTCTPKVDKVWKKGYTHRKLTMDCLRKRFISKNLYDELLRYNKERNVFTHNALKYWEYKKTDFEEQYGRGMKIKAEMEKKIKIHVKR